MRDTILPHTPVPEASRVAARLQLHHALQVLPVLTHTFIEHAEDWSEVNLGWDAGKRALVARPIPAGDAPMQLELQVAQPSIAVVVHGRSESMALQGATLQGLRAWVWERCAAAGLGPEPAAWSMEWDMPDHSVASGDVPLDFAGLGDALEDLARWFHNGFAALERVTPDGATGPRCWPHHFDVGLLISRGRSAAGEAQSIGLGLSPGDNYYAAPYYYASPWPYPDASSLPELTGAGRWHTRDFVSVVLQAAAVVGANDQEVVVRDYFDEAIEVGERLLPMG